MICSSCQHENPEGAKFCNACGAKLESACPQCGHVNPPGSRFCNECGFNLTQAPSTAPERRLAFPQSYTPKHLAEGRHDEAWTYATQSLEMATRTDSRKHVARAQQLQGEILATSGRLEEAARILDASVGLAESLQTPREVWMGKAALGKVLARLGQDKEAEVQFTRAARTIEAIAQKLKTLRLRQSFLGAEPVLEVYRALGRRPPQVTP